MPLPRQFPDQTQDIPGAETQDSAPIAFFSRPKLMGILNVTPDSFSDGGDHLGLETALGRAHQMIQEGADIIDIGGESSRPGAKPLPLQQELDRVLPLVRALKQDSSVSKRGVKISIDTYKPEVMHACLDLGADMINDIQGLSAPNAVQVCAKFDAYLCIMHMLGEPKTMQDKPAYEGDILNCLISFFESRLAVCDAAGIDLKRILIDPGFGFGKTFEHNWQVLGRLNELGTLDCPILVGLSRKSMLGSLLELPLAARDNASVAAAMFALTQGASILRVHDVALTQQAIKIYEKACSVLPSGSTNGRSA